MNHRESASRRQALQSVARVVAAGMAESLLPRPAAAHEGHDHAPRTILDLKGKLVRIVGPNDVVTQEFIQDRVTIHVITEGRIFDLVYG